MKFCRLTLQQGFCFKIRYIQFVCVCVYVFIKTETSFKKRVLPKLDFIQHVSHSEIRFHQSYVALKIPRFV